MTEMQQRPASRFMSNAECAALAKRVAAMTIGGGESGVRIESWWRGNVRYARNEVTTSGDSRNNLVTVVRNIRGAQSSMICNQIDDTDLQAAVRRAERLVRTRPESGGVLFGEHFIVPPSELLHDTDHREHTLSADEEEVALQSLIQTPEAYAKPKIFFETTYNLDTTRRAEVVLPLIESAQKAKVFAAGYIQVSADGRAIINTLGQALYYPFTKAQFSVTVRDPSGTGSGWAGVDWSDWNRIDTQKLSDIAVDKCLRSRNPVAVEPGRYTAILEPQAVCDLCWHIVDYLDRKYAEAGHGPFAVPKGNSRIGEAVTDERISISADPMDPDLGFPPFSLFGAVYHPVTWIDRGVLKELAYPREYGIKQLGKNSGLPNSRAFRMSGGTATIEDMIASTKRGLWVTRFSGVSVIDEASLLCTGYTRDGLWLIENGKVTKAVKNFRFTESPMFVLNNVEALGVPQRVFHPGSPVVVPPIKVRDFSFTSLSEAI